MQEVPSFIVLQLVHATNRLHVYSGSVQLVIFLSLCGATPALVRFQSSTGTRGALLQQICFRNYLLVRLIPHLLVCEIPLHTLLIYCRDHTFVETQVSISGHFVSQTLVVRFRLDVFPTANEHSSVRRFLLRLWE